VDRTSGQVPWTPADRDFPKPPAKIEYNYEFQPLRYDTRRDRLVLLKGNETRVDVYVRALEPAAKWQRLETSGAASIGREAVYIPRHDTLLWLGDKRLFALDCGSTRMGEVRAALPEGVYATECAMVYDPKLDVCVALIPRSFSGPMQTFLYRFVPEALKRRPDDEPH